VSRYQLAYDTNTVGIEIPDHNVNYAGVGSKYNGYGDNRATLYNALQNPVGTRLREMAAGKNLALLLYDAARKIPLDDVLSVMFPELLTARNITIFLATGTHDSNTPANKAIVVKVQQAAKDYNLPLEEIVIHDCHGKNFLFCGQTPTWRNPIYINGKISKADVFLVFSDMKYHYFAGYSNALKNFFPGLARIDAIERNHALAMNQKSTYGFHPLHPKHGRRDNPLALDIWEAYKLLVADRPVFTLNIISSGEEILWANSGLLEQVLPAGIEQVDRLMSIEVEPADRSIVSCGGYPNDESLYMAQRALELTKSGVNRGGRILLVAGCKNGIGPQRSIENFYNPLTKPIKDILAEYQHKPYIMYAHKTFKFAQLIASMQEILLYSDLPDEIVEKIHLRPVHNIQEQVDRWLASQPDLRINIFGEGSKIAVQPKQVK